MTPQQIQQALYNTIHQPSNHAPVIWEALKKGKPAPLADGYGPIILVKEMQIHHGTDSTKSQI